MSKYIRQLQGQSIEDPSSIENLTYNNAAGSRKVSEVGRHLLPFTVVTGGVAAYTTNATTARGLDFPGMCLAVYNNAGAVGSITLGSSSAVASLAPGAVSADGKSLGYPCAPNAWTYIACDLQNWVISSAATLLVFIVDDWSKLKVETP